MKKTLRRFCLSTVLCGTALLAAMQQGAAQSESASSRILRTTPQSVEDLQRIEHQLQAVLPKVLPALVCIQVNNSSGTGILVSEKGLIFSAAENSDSDAGIAKISTRLNKNLPIVEKAENQPQVGDWVFSLGHGGGLDRERGPMVRLGRIVSLKNDVIQTDCKLIRGDSGGPLFNLNGELIGIHSRVGSGLEDNLHVPMKEFDALTAPPEEVKEASPDRNG